MSEWQLIETAPKDGTSFVVWGEGEIWWEWPVYDSGGGICDVNQESKSFDGWHECFFDKEAEEFFVNGLETYFTQGGYAIHRYNDGTIKQIDTADEWAFKITHWMLPEPPK